MATIKSYTDIDQSKKLAEILPIESADMYYWCADHYPKEDWIIEVGTPDDNYECIWAWSLAALLDILKDKITFGGASDKDWFVAYTVKTPRELLTIYESNLVDACVAMIEKLHELKML